MEFISSQIIFLYGNINIGVAPGCSMLPTILSKIRASHHVYIDRRFKGTESDYKELMDRSRTIYLGNLPAGTKEEQIWALLRRNNVTSTSKTSLSDTNKNTDAKDENAQFSKMKKTEFNNNLSEIGDQKNEKTQCITENSEKDDHMMSQDDSFILYSGEKEEISEQTKKHLHYNHIKRIIMGRNRLNNLFCGFLFVEFYDRKDALYYSNLLKGYRMDGNNLTVNMDYGFQEGRQYGRGFAGGSVRGDYKKGETRKKHEYTPGKGRGPDSYQKNIEEERQRDRYFYQPRSRHQQDNTEEKRRRYDNNW